MLDILEIAREKGLEEGKAQGIEEGSIQTAREMLLDALIEKFGVVPSRVLDKIKKI